MKPQKKRKYADPFRESGTILFEVWRRAKQGVKEEEIIAYVRSRGADPARILRELKKGKRAGFVWDVDDARGQLKVTNIRFLG